MNLAARRGARSAPARHSAAARTAGRLRGATL
jgi:hypothetical protein